MQEFWRARSSSSCRKPPPTPTLVQNDAKVAASLQGKQKQNQSAPCQENQDLTDLHSLDAITPVLGCGHTRTAKQAPQLYDTDRPQDGASENAHLKYRLRLAEKMHSNVNERYIATPPRHKASTGSLLLPASSTTITTPSQLAQPPWHPPGCASAASRFPKPRQTGVSIRMQQHTTRQSTPSHAHLNSMSPVKILMYRRVGQCLTAWYDLSASWRKARVQIKGRTMKQLQRCLRAWLAYCRQQVWRVEVLGLAVASLPRARLLMGSMCSWRWFVRLRVLKRVACQAFSARCLLQTIQVRSSLSCSALPVTDLKT